MRKTLEDSNRTRPKDGISMSYWHTYAVWLPKCLVTYSNKIYFCCKSMGQLLRLGSAGQRCRSGGHPHASGSVRQFSFWGWLTVAWGNSSFLHVVSHPLKKVACAWSHGIGKTPKDSRGIQISWGLLRFQTATVYFCHIPLIRVRHKTNPEPGSGEIHYISW